MGRCSELELWELTEKVHLVVQERDCSIELELQQRTHSETGSEYILPPVEEEPGSRTAIVQGVCIGEFEPERNIGSSRTCWENF